MAATYWATRLNETTEILDIIRQGESTTVGSRTYTSADLEEVERDYRLYLVEAAIEGLLTGALKYSIAGRTFERNALPDLKAERTDIKAEIASATRVAGSKTGIRMRYGVSA